MQNGSDITTDDLHALDDLVASFEGLNLRVQGIFLDRVKDSFDTQRASRKAALLAELEALGLEGEESGEAPRARRTVKPSDKLYRSKTDPEKTWVGRGKMPGWMVEEMSSLGTTDKAVFLVV